MPKLSTSLGTSLSIYYSVLDTIGYALGWLEFNIQIETFIKIMPKLSTS